MKTYVVGQPDGRLEIHAVGQTGYHGICPACYGEQSYIAVGQWERYQDHCNVCHRKWVGEQRGGEFVATWKGNECQSQPSFLQL